MPPLLETPWRPWDEVDRMGATVTLCIMTGALLGACEWSTKTIYLNVRSTAVQTLCTLTHELLHLRRGPLMCTSSRLLAREEAAIAAHSARLLVPMVSLLDALRWTPHLVEQAEFLGVDTDTVRARFGDLSSEELAAIRAQLRQEEVA